MTVPLRLPVRTLVGRTRELEVVHELLRGCATGRAGALLVTGEAGIGKSALLREATSQAASSVDVVWASCLPLSTLSVPFLPLASALRRHSGEPGPLDDLDGAPDHALTAVDDWLDRECLRRPVVLVVDDLQWADRSTLDVLLYVLAGPEHRRLAVVMTVRQGEEGALLPDWLANVRRLPRTGELRLPRLDRIGVQEQLTALSGQPPHASLVDQLYGKAAGNPYLTELLARGLDADAKDLPPGLPDDLHAAVSRTWRRLTPDARALSTALAVAGHPQSGERLAWLAQTAGVQGDAVRLLRECVDTGVVERHEDGYWFHHPLLAEVLEQELLPEERRALHAALARSLAATVGDGAELDAGLAAEVADHHAGAGHRAEALRWAMTAAASAERAGGAAEALRLLRRAHDLRPEVASSPGAEVELLRRMADAAERCGDVDAAIEAVDQLLVLADPGVDQLLVAELLVRRIELDYESGRVLRSASLGSAERAVRLSSSHRRSALHAIAVGFLAESENWAGAPRGPSRAREAVSLAEASGSARAMAVALVARATARMFAGEVGALEDALAAEDAAAAAGDFRTYVDAVCAANNAIDIGFTNPTQIEHANRSRERLLELKAPHRYVAWLSAADAYGALMRGDWKTCVELLRLALGSTPGPAVDCLARLTAALLDTRQGRWHQGAQHLARVVELETAPHVFFGYHAIRSELALARGDNRAALDAAVEGMKSGRANLNEHLLPLGMRALANEVQSLRDHGRDAAAVLEQARSLWARHPQVLFDSGPGSAHQASVEAMQVVYEAELARAEGRSDASGLWVRAAECCSTAGLAWDEAYAWWRAAEQGVRAGAAKPASKVLLSRAHRMAVELEASPLVREIEDLAHQRRIPLPAEPHHEDAAPFELPGLTRREWDVLALVMTGSTYAEIAAELFISEKTVSSHISHMLRKTNTAGRLELAQLAGRLSSSPTTSTTATS